MIERLKERFEQNPRRHQGICWAEIQPRLTEEKLLILQRMEETGGEPDVIGRDGDRILYADCAAETPAGRRSVCYDEAARAARKKNPPEESVERQAQAIGVTLMNEEQYRHLQTLGAFDLKTSSWIATPPAIRALGVRHRLRLSQRSRFLLLRSGLAGRAAGVKNRGAAAKQLSFFIFR